MKKMIKEIKAILSIYKAEESQSKGHITVSSEKDTKKDFIVKKEHSSEKTASVMNEARTERNTNWKKKLGVAAVILCWHLIIMIQLSLKI